MKRAAIALVLIAIVTIVSLTAFAQAKKTEKAKDPVCGILVEKDPALSVSHK
jgi:hypothetical protein